MKKRRAILVVFLVLLSLVFGSIAQAATQNTSISVSPSSVEASHGDSFTIEIRVEPGDAEIYGAQYDLYFNPALLKATSQTPGTFLSQDGATTNVIRNETNNSVGKIEYGEFRTGAEHGVTNPGVLASITFEVVGTSGTSELKLSDVILSDPEAVPVETSISSGRCTIAPGAPGPGTSSSPSTTPTYTDITAEEAHRMFEENPAQIIFLDVRSEEEYNAEHILEAKLIPLPELESRIGELDAGKKIIVYCQTGVRSRTASETLVQQGFPHIYNMLGGINAWRLLYPDTLIKPTPSISETPSPTPTPAISPSPVLSPSPVISPSPSASPIASPSPTPTSTPPHEGKWRIPGFEAAFAIAGLLVISYFILKRRKSDRR